MGTAMKMQMVDDLKAYAARGASGGMCCTGVPCDAGTIMYALSEQAGRRKKGAPTGTATGAAWRGRAGPAYTIFGDRMVIAGGCYGSSIGSGRLKRIGAPQGTFVRKADGSWRRAGSSASSVGSCCCG